MIGDHRSQITDHQRLCYNAAYFAILRDKNMKKIIKTVIFSIFVLCAASCTFAAGETLNSVVAIVNQDVVTQSELNAAVAQAQEQLAAAGNPTNISDDQLRTMALQQLIDQKLQLELAKQAKISVTNAQVNQAISHIAEQNHFSVTELKNQLAQRGVQFSTYHQLIHDQLLIHLLQQKAVASKIHITQTDIDSARKLYQSQINAQQEFHIIDIRTDTLDSANQIVAQLKKGEAIETAAANQSHDMGWQTAATLPALFLNQLQTMKAGDISEPIQAPNGYHILKLVESRGQSITPTKTQLQNIAYQMQFQKAVASWLKELRETAYIKIM